MEMDQFEFSDQDYADQLDPLLASFGAESQEFAARKAVMVLELCRTFGSPKFLNVLDVGCGPGVVDSFLSGPVGRLTCVDSSPQLIEAARAKQPEVDFQLVEEGQALPFEDDEFELAFFSCVLHHVPPAEWSRFIQEVARVVKPGGLVVCIEHNPWNPVTRRIVSQCPFDEGVTLVSAPKVKALFEAAGLEHDQTFFHIFFPGSLRALQSLEQSLGWCPLGGQHTVVGRKTSTTDAPIDWQSVAAQPSSVRHSLIMPFFNEVEGAEQVTLDLYRAFVENGSNFEIVLADNGCVDGTSEILANLVATYPEIKSTRVFPNRGYGWGVQHGLAASRGEVVGIMAGDGQIRPSDVLATFDLYEEGRCDMAKVRRMTRGDGPGRYFISLVWNLIFSLALGRRVEDGNGTPKVFARSELANLNLSSKDWFLDSEIWMRALSRNWRIEELEVDFLPREEGASHVRMSTVWEFLRNTARWVWRYRSQRRKGEPL